MNPNTIKALGRDALYQVLDNSVFRILVGLTTIPILLTFLIGFRESEIVFLFGLQRWSYDGLLQFLGNVQGLGAGAFPEAQSLVIDVLLSLIFDYVVGWFGVLFCIAATAFFVPNMIEKGAADILFHKPVSRLTFYLARYFSGLLFIGILSIILVGGMQLGLLLVSGYNDPGIIFGAFQLIYVFGAIYSVCMLVGVVTRSTVGATLLTVLFFMFNGCIHGIWAGFEQTTSYEAVEKEKNIQAAEEEEDLEKLQELEERFDDPHMVLEAFRAVVYTLHYTLPKTGDAPIIAGKLRKSIDPIFYRHEESRLAMFSSPAGWEAADELTDGGPFTPPLSSHELGELQLDLSNPDSDARFRLWVRPATTRTFTVNKKSIERTERMTRLSADIEDELEERTASPEVKRKSRRFGESRKGKPIFGAGGLQWSEEGGWHHMLLFKLGNHHLFTSLLEAPDAEQGETLLEELNQAMGLDSGTDVNWYEKQLSTGAPLKYNIYFSIGSTLAFTILALLLGWWRLSRIEF